MNEVNDILERSETMLKAAYAGLNQYQNSEGQEKIIGLYNAATFGRSVTLVLPNLRGRVGEFDEWYGEKVDFLKSDPVCRHMKEVRNKVLKEGDSGIVNHMELSGFDPMRLHNTKPSWADGSFVSDQYGGDGFYVNNPDGSRNKFYFDFDFENVNTGLYFEETQSSSEQPPHRVTYAESDLVYYIRVLAEIVADAKREFDIECTD